MSQSTYEREKILQFYIEGLSPEEVEKIAPSIDVQEISSSQITGTPIMNLTDNIQRVDPSKGYQANKPLPTSEVQIPVERIDASKFKVVPRKE
jgi:hypothetical protein